MVSEEQLIKYLCEETRDKISAEIRAEQERLDACVGSVLSGVRACMSHNARIAELQQRVARVSPDYIRALLVGDAVKQAGLEGEVAKILALLN